MIRQRWVFRSSFGALAILAAATSFAWGQYAPGPSARPQQAGNGQPPGLAVPNGPRADVQTAVLGRPEWIVQNALRANPLTAPYPIAATWRHDRVVLVGRVGTKQVHDVAVQMAIACGYPFRDDLVIDTAETFRVAMSSTPSMTGYGALAPNLSASYYVYPQPLFGRLDDPFFGMEPPLLSFAPWWGNRLEVPMGGPNGGGQPGANRFPAPNGPGPAASNPQAVGNGGGGPAVPNPGAVPFPGPDAAGNVPGVAGNPPVAPENPFQPPPAKGDVELTVDASGQVFLRGVVASEEIAREIEQTAWSVPGVTRVVTQFQVKPPRAAAVGQDAPPPLPQPVVAPAAEPLQVKPRRVDEPAPGAVPPPPAEVPKADQPVQPPAAIPALEPPAISVTALDNQRLSRRVVDSLRKRPAVAGQPIKVRSTGDAVMLSGQIPTAYEAMVAYRAAQQTPGVRDVVDRLEFLVPDENRPNPLIQKGRPEDIEPYLIAQMARHVGDLAHIDSVKAQGNHLEIRGSLLDAADRDRVLAILRSIPVLHGFRLEPTLTTD